MNKGIHKKHAKRGVRDCKYIRQRESLREGSALLPEKRKMNNDERKTENGKRVERQKEKETIEKDKRGKDGKMAPLCAQCRDERGDSLHPPLLKMKVKTGNSPKIDVPQKKMRFFLIFGQ